jgi:hypothetical protein
MLKKAKKIITKFADKIVRANWYVLKYQMDKVKAKAKKMKISESEVIRDLIDNNL